MYGEQYGKMTKPRRGRGQRSPKTPRQRGQMMGGQRDVRQERGQPPVGNPMMPMMGGRPSTAGSDSY